MAVIMTAAQRKRQAVVDMAGALASARLCMAIAGLNGRSRLSKLLEAAEAEVYAQADEETLWMIAARVYEDTFNRCEFVARQLQKRQSASDGRRQGVLVSRRGHGLGIGIENEQNQGKAPGGQGALPFVISGNSDGKASL